MRKALPFICFLFTSTFFAQPGKEAWHWCLGNNIMMDFSSGAPVATVASPLWNNCIGSASVSDAKTGQFLFCLQANRIFNSNHATMYNSYNLIGDYAATQELVVPNPGYSSIYYAITVDDGNLNAQGIHFSVVDMSLQGGLGGVTLKNQLLMAGPATTKVTAVRHCNGIDYWILTHPANSNNFNAYLLTSTGLNTTPIVSSVGTNHQFLTSDGYQMNEGNGQLKASPNGKKIAVGIFSYALPVFEILDFDNSTGVVSNPVTINYTGGMSGPYGLSFSSDNSKVYCAPFDANDNSYVYQYDLTSNIPATIIASQTQVGYHYSLGGWLAEMQLAPDGKIYISRYYKDTLGVISSPNNAGLSCNFQLQGLKLPGAIWAGLPNFIDANYAGIQINIPDVQLCSALPSEIVDAGAGFSNYFWSTGASTQTITVSSPGKYWVTVTNGQGCTRTDTINAYLVQPFKIDTVVCDSFKANVTQPGAAQYLWNDSTSNPIKTLSQSGSYYVDVTFQSGCVLRDSVKLAVISSPHVDLGPPVSLCDFKLELNAYYPGTTINWSTGATTSSITVNQPGTYWVTLQNSSGCTGTDTLVIGPPWQLIDLLIPNIVTPNDDKINDEISFEKFKFSAFTINIYNRWGQKVFESDSPNAVWKPTGDEGTYFYTGQYKLDCGTDSQTKEIKGFITAVR